MKAGEKYPNPLPICAWCEKEVSYRLRGHCTGCDTWSHQGSCSRRLKVPGFAQPKLICYKCVAPHLVDWERSCAELDIGDSRESALILFAAIEHGTDEAKIHEATGVSSGTIAERTARLRENGIWTDEGLAFDKEIFSDKPNEANIAFILACLCADGLLIRVPNDKPAKSQEL